ncbi:MAG: hypothetical protein FWE10_07265, partial [Rikenellaceae bacterium]|nr:hypothetical protein [Rikenellaceae bacterium]MCL2693243.1 hypothetical protein [Rikenellaceae bacterium]
YVDSDGTIYMMECYPGLVWNQELCSCYWPEFTWQQYPNSHSSPPPPPPFEYSVAELLVADAAGAATGAMIGMPLGVFGMAMGAMIVAPQSSAYNALMQHLSKP